MKSEEPLVCTITLNWNTKRDTSECIRSLLSVDYSNYRTLVVDNGSTDESVKFLRRKFGEAIEILENSENLGYPGFNIGIERAMIYEPDYLLIHNSDVIFDKAFLTELVKIAETDDMIGFVSGKVYYYKKPNVIQTAGKLNNIGDSGSLCPNVGHNENDEGQYDEVRDYDYIDDVFLLVNSRIVREFGGYDPDYFLMCEIEDWCLRIRRSGYRIVYAPRAKIWHKGSLSSGGQGNPVSKYYLTRNQIVFMRKNFSGTLVTKFLIMNLMLHFPKEVTINIIRSRFDIVSAIVRGKVSAIIWLISNKKPTKKRVIIDN